MCFPDVTLGSVSGTPEMNVANALIPGVTALATHKTVFEYRNHFGRWMIPSCHTRAQANLMLAPVNLFISKKV